MRAIKFYSNGYMCAYNRKTCGGRRWIEHNFDSIKRDECCVRRRSIYAHLKLHWPNRPSPNSIRAVRCIAVVTAFSWKFSEEKFFIWSYQLITTCYNLIYISYKFWTLFKCNDNHQWKVAHAKPFFPCNYL